MRVLAVSHSCVVDVNQQLFVSLRRQTGVDLHLIVPALWRGDYSPALRTPTVLEQVDFPVHRLPVGAPGRVSLHFYRWGLTRAILRVRPDIVFVDEEPWSLCLAQLSRLCRRFQIPLVCYTKQNIRKSYPAPFSWIEQSTYRSAAAIVALSEEVRAVLRAKGFRGSCPVLPHACDPALFYPRPSDEQRQSLGLRGIVVGYMGRLVREKGLDTLVRAMARVRQISPGAEVTVLIAGAGPEEANLRQMVAEAGLHGRVVFAPPVPHHRAGDLIRCMDIFVLPSKTTPSWKEQFGRVVIEAMVCQVPVIGSDSGQIPYLIEDTGGGLVFQEGDSSDLAAKLLTLLKAPRLRTQLGEVGAREVRGRYTYDAVARQLHQILQNALAPACTSGSTDARPARTA